MLYELVLFIQCHVANVMTEVTVLAGVASLATLVAGQWGRFCVLVPSTFLGLTGGRAGGYGLIGACIDAGDEVDEVARQENENRVHVSVGWAYQGIVDCDVGHWEA
jgi:hypothetical protein